MNLNLDVVRQQTLVQVGVNQERIVLLTQENKIRRAQIAENEAEIARLEAQVQSLCMNSSVVTDLQNADEQINQQMEAQAREQTGLIDDEANGDPNGTTDGSDDVVIETDAEMGQPSLADVIEQDLSPGDEEALSKVQVATPPPNTTKHVSKEAASAKPTTKQPGKKTLDELIEQQV
ncbi:MAG: hypothetical protein AAF639_39300 [Chloroflexota bacterium]